MEIEEKEERAAGQDAQQGRYITDNARLRRCPFMNVDVVLPSGGAKLSCRY